MFKMISTLHPSWANIISTSPEATIFHHPAWMQNLQYCYGYRAWIAAEMEGDNILAGLPVMEVKSLAGTKRLLALPFSDYCFPLARHPSDLPRLASSLMAWSKQQKTPIEVRWKLPALDGIQTSHDYVLHTATLDSNPDVVFERIHRKVRKYIRSSANRGVRVEQGASREFLRQFYHLQLMTRRKHGLPAQPWKYFDGLGKNILEKGLGFVLLAFVNDECLAGLVVLHWGRTLTLKYGASVEDRLRDLRPNHLLDWTAIRWGCEQGYQILDVGRSDIDQDGLRDYKNRWGYREEALDYSFIGSQPPQSRKEGLIGKVFRGVMRRSPLWLCQAAGTLLYAYFP
jgi:CelD/BcsL family acetyltransferase involved in cellulose biosynthesis